MRRLKTLVIVLTAVLLTASAFAGEKSKTAKPGKHEKMGGQMMDGKMMEQCKAMMAKHQEMQAQMETLDTKLEVMLATAKAATGDQKIDALTSVVEELVVQRREMRAGMMSEMPQMMGHMMGHMQKGMPMSMEDCPMMKGAMGAPGKETGAGEHSEHH